MKRKSLIILPRLNERGGDLSKNWYVEYSVRNPMTDRMVRFRKYDFMVGVASAERRRKLADEYMSKLKEELLSGVTPFKSQNVVYDNPLKYDAVSRHEGRQSSAEGEIQLLIAEFTKSKRIEVNKKSLGVYISQLRTFESYLRKKGLLSKPILMIDSDIIDDFLRNLVEEYHLCRKTIEKYHQILFSFFKWVLKRKKSDQTNPVLETPKIGKIVDESPWPIPEHDRKILAEAMKKNDRQLWLACMLQYYCAMRPGVEIRLLKVKDIDFEGRSLRIHSDTAKANRTETIDMPRQVYEELLFQRIDQANKEYYVFGRFGYPAEKNIGLNNLPNRFVHLRDSLNMTKDYKFYSWKHTGAGVLADMGASSWEIQAHLRHRSVATTERYLRRRVGLRNNKFKENFPDI